MKPRIIINFLILFFLASCKKDVNINYRTIYPLPYLPVYPGSYWKYLTENGDTIIYRTSDKYVLDSFSSINLGGMTTDPVYVPLWNGSPVYGYSFRWVEDFGETLVPYLKEENNSSWSRGGPKWWIDDIVIAKDTSIVVLNVTYNSVIVVKESKQGYGIIPGITYSYYAKNIGLIKETHTDVISPDTTQRQLIYYHINY